MRFLNYTVEEAVEDMRRFGYHMDSEKYASLEPQVRALKEFIDGKECTQEPQHCVQPSFQ
jgi:hypothetical protein